MSIVLQEVQWTPPDGRSIADWRACQGLPCDEYHQVQQILAEIRLIEFETKRRQKVNSVDALDELVSAADSRRLTVACFDGFHQ